LAWPFGADLSLVLNVPVVTAVALHLRRAGVIEHNDIFRNAQAGVLISNQVSSAAVF